MLKVCVFGAGAVGGYLAGRLGNRDDIALSLVARGAHLAAIRQRGLRVIDPDLGDVLVTPHAATDAPATLPPQDLVIVTLKSTALAGAASAIGALLKPQGVALFVTNGIPWWWNHGAAERAHLTGQHPVDPDGALWREVRPERSLGCVAVSSNLLVEPGVVRHAAFNSWKLGEPDNAGAPAGRAESMAALLRACGLEIDAAADLREEIWRKLLINIPNHSLASLTRLATDQVYERESLRQVARALITEVVAIAAACGTRLEDDIVDRAMSRFVPNGRGAKPSMLQDVEAGRRLEVPAVFSAVLELGKSRGVATPCLGVLHALLLGLDAGIGRATG